MITKIAMILILLAIMFVMFKITMIIDEVYEED